LDRTAELRGKHEALVFHDARVTYTSSPD
jgi:hypothetical protein